MHKIITFLAFAVLSATGETGVEDTSSGGVRGLAMQKEGMVFRLYGTAKAEQRYMDKPIRDGTTMADCFDVKLLDPATGKELGYGTDCLADVRMVDGGLALVGTTTFTFENGDSFTSRGGTTVQPTTTAPLVSPGYTHITGSIPPPTKNSIIGGTGKYGNGWKANVRLSGAVNMSKLESDGKITFDCLFVVTPL